MSKIFQQISKSCHKLFKKHIYAEITIYIKDGNTDEILHIYPVQHLYEGDMLEVGPLKLDVNDIEWT